MIIPNIQEKKHVPNHQPVMYSDGNKEEGNVSVSTLPHFEHKLISALAVQKRSVAEHGSEGTAPLTTRNGSSGRPKCTTVFSLSSSLGWYSESFQAPDVSIMSRWAGTCSSSVLHGIANWMPIIVDSAGRNFSSAAYHILLPLTIHSCT